MREAIYYLSGVKFLNLNGVIYQKDFAGRKVISISDALNSNNPWLRDIARVLKGIYSKIVIEN